MMTDDAKEWVTIKVPKEQRDAARDRPETYGEVLAAGVEALSDGPITHKRTEVELPTEELAEAIWLAIEELDAEGRPRSDIRLGKDVQVSGTLKLETFTENE